ncbi:hypothetical protein C8R44DRAFT_7517 [Mycena epipterygia]|nr:hypothetical protein C8R44DRAFT_7517 [Mycena epipterygia]
MLFQLPTSALLLSLVLLTEASSHGHGAHLANMRRRQLNPRGPQPVADVPVASLGRRSCRKKATSSSSTLKASSTPATIVNVAPAPSTTEKASPTTTSSTKAATTSTEAATTSTEAATTSTEAATTSTEAATTSTKAATTSTEAATTSTKAAAPTTKAATTSTKAAAPTTKATTSSPKSTAAPPSSGGVAAGGFVAVKPADWPTATQAGPQPTSTVASASDPYLEELSKAIDNSGNPQFTSTHTGDMTYYGQGLGACGDVYDDNSFTAAVSHLMFDSWIGFDTDAQNRNPICGPFVPGRQALDNSGLMVSAVKSTVPGYAEIGGDGLINCVGSTNPIVQCHVPLTATVTHGGKSIQVKIVDRCAACAEGDIDLTPAAFAALADPALGRTSVTWKFDNW